MTCRRSACVTCRRSACVRSRAATCHQPCKSQATGPCSSGVAPFITIVADDNTGTCAAAERRDGAGGGRNTALNQLSHGLPEMTRVNVAAAGRSDILSSSAARGRTWRRRGDALRQLMHAIAGSHVGMILSAATVTDGGTESGRGQDGRRAAAEKMWRPSQSRGTWARARWVEQ